MVEVIILAAGIGSRLRPLTSVLPKCCIQISGESLISRITRQLLSFNPNISITIVGGYLIDIVKNETLKFGKNVKIIENQNFESTNNMFSCLLALRKKTSLCDTIIINADCIYDDIIIEKMLHSSGNFIAVDTDFFSDESMKALLRNGKLISMSKNLNNNSDVVTSLDFYRFNHKSLFLLKGIMEDFVEKNQLNLWTEVAIDRLMEDISIGYIDFRSAKWVEIDDYRDLSLAEGIFSDG